MQLKNLYELAKNHWPVTLGIVAIFLTGSWPFTTFKAIVFFFVLGASFLFDQLYVQREQEIESNKPAVPVTAGGTVTGTKKSSTTSARDLNQIWAEIDSMIGLESVKTALRDVQTSVEGNIIKRQQGMDVTAGTLHMVFRGNPGTGKTEIARKVGELYCAMGVLPGDTFVEATKADLVGEYVGHTAPKVEKLIQGILDKGGGVLFIDEAYSITTASKGSSGDFGEEAVAALLKMMDDNRDKICVIMAGYEKEMDNFVNKTNPGLKSRIAFYLDFPDYTPDELIQILQLQARRKGYEIEPDAIVKVREHLPSVNMQMEGNGRYIRNLLEKAERKQSYRVVDGDDPEVLIADDFDVEPVAKTKKPRKDIRQIWAEIDSMIGLDSVKKALRDVQATVQANIIKKQDGMDVTSGTLHMVFKGNPGTGKTEMAKKVGELYAAMGALPGSALVTCTVGDLIGEYVGQTRPKTRAKVQEVLNQGGGILFIDEAYGLLSGQTAQGGNFGAEATEELLQWMDNQRDKLCVILAGYEKEMDHLIEKGNPGLQSRFPKKFRINFPDYSPDELIQILQLQAQNKGYTIASDAIEKIRKHLPTVDMKTGGNGRYVRNMLEAAEQKQSHRVLAGEDPRTLTADDFDI